MDGLVHKAAKKVEYQEIYLEYSKGSSQCQPLQTKSPHLLDLLHEVTK